MFRVFALLVALFAAVTSAAAQTQRSVAIKATVPEGTGPLFITGSTPELGNWDPDKVAMEGTGRSRTKTVKVADGAEIEFKFTLGSWEREALGPSGTLLPNYKVTADVDKEVTFEVVDFKKPTADYLKDWQGSGVKGRLDYYPDFPSKNLGRARHVEVWLPPGYDENPERRYQVLYMHDGQNLFDPRIANTGVDWGVDESVTRLVDAGKIDPIIVVGLWSTEARIAEYDPWKDGPKYAKFLAEEVMPMVNAKYRTLTGPENTGAMGSSLGGLISFYLGWKHADTFGKAGCLSTHFPWNGTIDDKTIPPFIEKVIADPAEKFPRSVKVYFDFGTKGIDASYEPIQQKVNEWLKSQGLVEGENFISKKFEGADHSEKDWRARLDEPFQFLFAKK